MSQLFSQYKQMFDKMADGAFFQRADGTLVDVNPAALELFGLTLDQFMGRTSYHPEWRVIDENGKPLPPEQHPSMVALRTGLQVRNFVAGVHNPLRQDTVWLEINATPLFKEGETAPSEVFVNLHDISDRKQTEESLMMSEEKFAKSFNLSPALMSISTIDNGCYLDVNDSFCRISGFTRQDVIGKTSVELGWIPAAKREEMKEILRRDGQINDVELELERRDGAVITVLYTAVIITISGQEHLLSIALDVTERKKNQDKLDYLSECFNQALNGSRHILYRLNVEKGCYDYLSPAAETIHGIPYADSLGYSLKQVFEFIHPDDRSRISTIIDSAIRTRTSNSIDLELEYRIRKTDDSYTWLLDSTRLVVDDSGQMQYFYGSAYDINTLKETSQSLRESEERYQAIVNTQTEFVDRYLPGGILTFVNEALCRYWGIRPADLIGKSFYPFLQEDDLQVLLARLAALTPENPCVDVVNRINFHDGTIHWHSWTHHAIFDQNGTVVEYQSVGRDITRQRLAEIAKNSYEAKLTLALKAAKAGMWDRDLTTNNITWSRETFILYGMDPGQDEASIAAWQQVLHPDDMAMIRVNIKESITQNIDFNVEHRTIMPDGSIRWLRAIGQPFYDREGRPLRLSGITLDITEQKKQEEALKRSEEMSRAILSSTNDLILFISPDGTILLANEAMAERFGQTVDSFVGTNIFAHLPEDIRRVRREKVAKALRKRSPVRFEDARADRFFDTCLFPVINKDKTVTGVAVFSHDISERKGFEAALKKVNEELEHRVEERTASLTAANDQIRQISFQLLQAEERERMRIAAELHDQVGQSLLLAKMKVDALTSDTATDKSDNNSADISRLLEDCIQDIRSLTFAMRPPLLDTAGFESALEWLCKSIYENYRIKIDFSRSCQSIQLNSEQRYSLYQSVRELLLNVVKHAGVTYAELSLKTAGSDLIIQVSDKGNGFSTKAETCTSAARLGFGLFNVSQRLNLLGGNYHLESELGKGTIVTLTIPMESNLWN